MGDAAQPDIEALADQFREVLDNLYRGSNPWWRRLWWTLVSPLRSDESPDED
jgi:hypothetical protein